jgi:ubiquitin-protein ligase
MVKENRQKIIFSLFLGSVCIDLFSRDGAWTPVSTLVNVVDEVTKIIDEPICSKELTLYSG